MLCDVPPAPDWHPGNRWPPDDGQRNERYHRQRCEPVAQSSVCIGSHAPYNARHNLTCADLRANIGRGSDSDGTRAPRTYGWRRESRIDARHHPRARRGPARGPGRDRASAAHRPRTRLRPVGGRSAVDPARGLRARSGRRAVLAGPRSIRPALARSGVLRGRRAGRDRPGEPAAERRGLAWRRSARSVLDPDAAHGSGLRTSRGGPGRTAGFFPRSSTTARSRPSPARVGGAPPRSRRSRWTPPRGPRASWVAASRRETTDRSPR